MSRDIFVGRTKELETITRELVRDPSEKGASKFFYIEGEENVGKSAFVSQIWENLVEVGDCYIWATMPEFSGGEKEHQLLEKMVQSMDSNKQNIIKKIGSFARAFGTASFEFQNQSNQNDENGVMEVWIELFKNHFYSDSDLESSELSLLPKVILTIEDFTRYPRVFRNWFKDTFITSLEKSDLLKHFQFIVTTGRSFSIDTESEAFWSSFKFNQHDTVLKTLTIDEIGEYLRKRGTPEISASRIFEKTGGFPGAVVKEIDKQEKQPVSEDIRKEITNILTGKTTRQKYWLKAAAHLSVCNEESFALFCHHDEVRKALDWLSTSSGIEFQNIGYGKVMDLDMSKKILRWLKSYEKEEFGRLLNIAEKYNEFVDAIPQPQARAMLTDLSAFHYFNSEVIRRVLRRDEKPYLELVRRAPEFFDVGKFNYRLNKDYRRVISNYRELLIHDHFKIYEMQIKKEWDLIKSEALNKKESLEKQMLVDQRELKGLRGEIDGLKGQMAIHREKVISLLDQNRKISMAKEAKAAKQGVRFPGMLYQFLGVFVVFISAAYPGAYSTVNLIAGILLIVYGTFGPYKRVPKVSVNTPLNKTMQMRKEDDEKVENDPNTRMLSFKKNNLEIRYKQLHNTLSRIKAQLKDIEKRLEEPYPVIGQ